MKVNTFLPIRLLVVASLYIMIRLIFAIENCVTSLLAIISNTVVEKILMALILILASCVMFFVAMFCLVKSSQLVGRYKLQKKLEKEGKEMTLLPSSKVMTVGTVIFGAIVLLEFLPQLCQQLFMLLREVIQRY